MTRFDLEMDGEMEASDDGRWVRYHDHMDAIAEKDTAYQQLMEKAVGFANYIKDEFTYDDDPRFIEADEFLQSPEVQAWKEHS